MKHRPEKLKLPSRELPTRSSGQFNQGKSRAAAPQALASKTGARSVDQLRKMPFEYSVRTPTSRYVKAGDEAERLHCWKCRSALMMNRRPGRSQQQILLGTFSRGYYRLGEENLFELPR
jgi:hypothetical protein